MIEIDCIVSCAKKEDLNLKKLQELKYKTYMSSNEIVATPFECAKQKNLANITYLPPNDDYDSIESNTYSKTLVNSGTYDIKYEPLKEKDYTCKYGMDCKKRVSGQCKYIHSAYKPDTSICKRGPTCPFLAKGVCAYKHT
jgi:hypothetical protein